MSQAQQNYEKILNIGVILLLLWHMLMTIGKIFFSFYKAEMIYAAVLLLLAIIYLCLCRFKWTGTPSRINLITEKIRTPNQFICITFFIWYILSLLVNKGPHLKDNFWLLYDVGINCLLLFNLPMILSKEKGKKIIDFLLHIVSLFGLCVVLYGLWHLFTLDFVYLESGEMIGMTKKFNFELGLYYNPTSVILLSLILISLYMIAAQKTTIKIIYTLTLIPYTLALYLTNSRGSFVACVFAYFCFIFLSVWNHSRQKSIISRFILSGLSAAAAAVILWELRPMAFQLFESITNFSTEKINALANLIRNNNGYHGLSAADEIRQCLILFAFPVFISKEKIKILSSRAKQAIKRSAKISMITALIVIFCSITQYISPLAGDTAFLFENSSVSAEDSSGELKPTAQTGKDYAREIDDFGTIRSREKIWKNAIKIMRTDRKTFLFGVTPLGFDDALKKIGAGKTKVYTAHNELLNMGVSLGAPMMFALLMLFISTGIKSVYLAFSEKDQSFEGAYVLPVIFFTFIFSTLIEGYLFASFTISSSLFFLVCGWINALDNTGPA